MGLDAEQLAAGREVVLGRLVDDCTIMKKIINTNPTSNSIETATGGTRSEVNNQVTEYVDGASFKCLVTIPRGYSSETEFMSADEQIALGNFMVTLTRDAEHNPAVIGSGVEQDDRIRVTDHESGFVEIYEVKTVLPHSQAFSHGVLAVKV